MSEWYAQVLYAKHVSRKRKTWQDGFVSVSNQDPSRQSAKLYDGSGVLISSCRVPASEHVSYTSEGISAFEGWIVNIDSVSQANDLPGNATAAAAAAARPTAAAAADMEVRARLPNQHNEQAQIAVAQQQCKKRPKFQQPRAAVVLPYDNAVMAVTKSQTESAHNPSGLKGGGKPPTSFLYTKPGSKQPVPQCLVQKRSDDEILGLLVSSDTKLSDTKLSDHTEAVQTRELVESSSKHRRLQHHPADAASVKPEPDKVALRPHDRKQSKWEEFTEPESNTMSHEPEAHSSFCTALVERSEVSPMPIGIKTAAEAAPAEHAGTGHHDQSAPINRLLSLHDKAHNSSPDCLDSRSVGASNALLDSTNTSEAMQRNATSWQHPSPTGSHSQPKHMQASLKISVLGKHKAFKAPALMPGPPPSQPQPGAVHTLPPCTKAVQGQQTGQAALVFCGPGAAPAARHVAIPTSFASLHAYKQVWCAAVTEEINIRLAGLAKDFYTGLQQLAHSMQKGGLAAQAQPKPADLEKGLRARKVAYYSKCELLVYQPHKSAEDYLKGKNRFRKRKAANSSDEETDKKDAASVFLQIQSGQERPSAYQKDDIWVLFSDPACQLATGGAGSRGSLQQGWVLLARSSWHGPNKDGRMQVQLLSDALPKLQRKQSIYAIRGPNATTELAMLATLQGLDAASVPALPALLSCRQRLPAAQGSITFAAERHEAASPGGLDASTASGKADHDDHTVDGPEALGLDKHASKIIADFQLNADQIAVLRHCSRWAVSDKGANPVCIIHGPFGCGKSSLLIALIQYLLAHRSQAGSSLKGCRVLLSAHTNVAVDRLMTGLLDTGCTDMVRVGALRRISKSLLPHSLHAVDSKAKSDGVSELKEMLAGSSNAAEAGIIQRELDQLKQGADRQRRKKLKSAAVVGVTCCSAGLPVLEGHSFDVVLLDEASQMVEPLTLNPLTTAKPRFIIMAGDPCQLPPVVASPASVTLCPSTSADAHRPAQGTAMQGSSGPVVHSPSGSPPAQGLAWPLLVRLVQMGHHAHLLRTQYRCHPEISRVSNALYYNSHLIDGCTAAQRPPLLPGLSAVCFVEVRGQQQYGHGSSSASNRAEAQAVVQMIKQFTNSGICSSSIGVICFFRAQVALIQGLLQSASSESGQPGQPPQLATAGHPAAEEQQHAAVVEEDNGSASVQVATVDSFQGMEKNIILLATTITHAGNFATDAQRVNVAFTRAKHHLVVFGCSHVLRSCSPAFKMLLAGCQMLPAGASFLSQSTAQTRGSAPPDSHAMPTAPSGPGLTPIPAEAFCGNLASSSGDVTQSSPPATHAGAVFASPQPDADTPSGAAAPSKSALPDGMHCPAGVDAPLTASMCSSPERLCSKVDGVAPGTANCHKPDEAAIADSPGADEEPLQELLIDI